MLTPEQLKEIEERAAHLCEYEDRPLPADVLAGTDVPALIDEVKRLQAEVAGRGEDLAKYQLACGDYQRAAFTAAAERDQARAERNEAKATLRKVAMVKVWTNEDSKLFVFLDELAEALGLTRAEAGEG